MTLGKATLATAILVLPLPLIIGGDMHQNAPSRAANPVVAEAVWQGRVTSTLDYGDYTEVLTGGVKFEYVSTVGSEDHYKITGGSVTWSAAGTDADCVYSGGPTVYALSQSNTDGEMIVFSNGRYTIGGALTAYPAGIISVVCDPPASRFCTSPEGTGQNAWDGVQSKRFGNADFEASRGPTQRGNCLGRICVNDSRPTH